MQFILKTFGTLSYVELHITDESIRPGEPLPQMRLIGHFNMTLAEREAFINRMMFGAGEAYFCIIAHVNRPDQAEVDRVFEDAIHQGASPEPITAAEPPPPSGREVIYQRPVSIPDPVGRPDPASPRAEGYRTRRSCCASFVGDPHGYRCQCAAEVPEYLKAGIDGSAQTVAIKNAQRDPAVIAGGLPGASPVSQQGGVRFVAVKSPHDDPLGQGFDWNVLDRTTGLYRMPGYVMTEAAALRSADRANGNPAEFEDRYQWQG